MGSALPNSVVLQVVEEDGKVIGTFTGRVQIRIADVEGDIAKEEEATGGVCLLLQWDWLVRVRQILAGAEGETVRTRDTTRHGDKVGGKAGGEKGHR